MTNDNDAPSINPEPMPGALLAGLFSTGIVVIPEEFEQGLTQAAAAENPVEPVAAVPTVPVQPEVGPDMPLNWLGNFKRQVLVVVNDPGALHINDADFELLGKILGAVKLSVADIALVNAAKYSLNYYTLNEKLPAGVALYFGIQPVDIGAPLKFPMFQVQNWNNTTFIYAPPLAEINAATPQAVALKKDLWAALKKVFG